MTTTPNASWPLPSLLRSLRKAGWGILAGYENQAIRGTLLGLADCLPDLSARGKATVLQVQASAGVSERWVRRCLDVLEEMNIITWVRGTIMQGNPHPSYFTINKKALVHLIRIARDEMSRRLEEHKQRYLARLKGIKNLTLPRYRKEKTGSQAELNTSLTTLNSESPSKVSDSPKKKIKPTTKAPSMEIIEPPKPDPSLMPEYCKHAGAYGKQIVYSCPECRFDATRPQDWAEYEAAKMRAERAEAQTYADPEAEQLNRELESKYPSLSPAQRARAYLQELKAKANA